MTTQSDTSQVCNETISSFLPSIAVLMIGSHAAAINDDSVNPQGATEFCDRAQQGAGDDVHGWGGYLTGEASVVFGPTFAAAMVWDSVGFSVDAAIGGNRSFVIG